MMKRRLALGQGMTEYAIVVAMVAISAISTFRYFVGVQRSQVAAIRQELAGHESGDMLNLANSYASSARSAANRDSGLSNYHGGGVGGSDGGIGGGGGTGSPSLPGGGGGSCPACAAEKASGAMYVWAADETVPDDCAEPEPLVKAIYLSHDLDFIKAAVKSFDVLKMFESYFSEGKTITFKVDNTISGSMQVLSTEPDTILVNLGMLTRPDNLLEAKHYASIVGHEVIHVYDINYRKKLHPRLPIDNRVRWQSEINASDWQIDTFVKLEIIKKRKTMLMINLFRASMSINA